MCNSYVRNLFRFYKQEIGEELIMVELTKVQKELAMRIHKEALVVDSSARLGANPLRVLKEVLRE